MTHKQFIKLLNDLGACEDAVTWVEENGYDLATAYRKCERADRMIWLFARMAGKKGWPTEAEVGLTVCCCAARVLKYVSEGEDRPANAIRTARRYWRGKATIEEVHAAWAAAKDAAEDASRSAANASSSAAWSAGVAAETAARSVWAAEDAAATTSSAAWAAEDAAATTSSAAWAATWAAAKDAAEDAAWAAANASRSAAWSAGVAAETAAATAEHRAMCRLIRKRLKVPVQKRGDSHD
jgi:hypothetical protein